MAETTSASSPPRSSQFRQTAPNKTSVGFAIPAAPCGTRADAEEMAAIVRAVIDTQLGEARLATERASSDPIREIAGRAAHDFGRAAETLNDLEGMEPFDIEETPSSRSLRSASGVVLGQLRSADAADFDRAYVEAAIVRRGALIELIDQMACQADPVLKRGLVELRATVAGALRDARTAAAALAPHDAPSR